MPYKDPAARAEWKRKQRATDGPYAQAERVRDRERNSRRVRMGAGGFTLEIGYMPTPETAQYLRRKIREEAPRA